MKHQDNEPNRWPVELKISAATVLCVACVGAVTGFLVQGVFGSIVLGVVFAIVGFVASEWVCEFVSYVKCMHTETIRRRNYWPLWCGLLASGYGIFISLREGGNPVAVTIALAALLFFFGSAMCGAAQGIYQFVARLVRRKQGGTNSDGAQQDMGGSIAKTLSATRRSSSQAGSSPSGRGE